MKIHPAATLFPEMSEHRFSALQKDIEENGLIEPILLCDGMILDGRHRFKACRAAGVEPRFEEWDGESQSAVKLVVSRNLHRRHLTKAQRAAVASEMLPMLEAGAEARKKQAGEHGTKGGHPRKPESENPVRQSAQRVSNEKKRSNARRATDEAAEATGSTSRQVQRMKKVRAKAPEVHRLAKEGKINVAQAEQLADLPENDRAAIIERGEEIGFTAAIKERAARAKNNPGPRTISSEKELERLVQRVLKRLGELNHDVRAISKATKQFTLDSAAARRICTHADHLAAVAHRLAE